MRASDADRELAADEIREHFAAGRLTEDELDARLSAAYGSLTAEELDRIRADLPALPPSPAHRRTELAARRSALQRELFQQTGGSLALFVLCVVIWLTSGANGQFWPMWVAIIPALTLLRGGWRLYGPAPELDRLERELATRRQLRAEHRDRALDRAGRRRRL